MKLLKRIIMVGTLVVGLPAFAGTQAGQIELGGTVAFFKPVGIDGFDAQALIANVSVGYFFTDALEAKFGLMTAVAWGQGTTMYLLAPTIGVDYHFLTSGKLVPYIGGSGGLAVVGGSSGGGSGTITGGIVEGHVGLKHFIGERTTINYQVGYDRAFVSAFGGDASVGFIMASIGVSYLF
jgi:hypothetical protein